MVQVYHTEENEDKKWCISCESYFKETTMAHIALHLANDLNNESR